jgi:hypothetical protein
VLYYHSDALKEKSLFYTSRTSVDGNSNKGQSETTDDDFLVVFWNGEEFIPLLSDDNDSDESSSEKSTELVAENSKNFPLKQKSNNDSDQEEADLDVYKDISKFTDEEFEPKLNLNRPSNLSMMKQASHDTDEEQLFSEIWNKPSEDHYEEKSLSKPYEEKIPSMTVSHIHGPPGLEMDRSNSNVSSQSSKRK